MRMQLFIIGGALLFLVIMSVALYRSIEALREQVAALARRQQESGQLFLQMGPGHEGPAALLLEQVAPALAAMARPGQTTSDVARELIEFSVRLAPEVAQRWALRALGLPFRRELIEPVIDETYADDLVSSSPVASRILAELQATAEDAPVSAASLVNTVLSDDAIATLTEELAGRAAPEDVTALVEQMQKRAVEQQLERDIPAERAAAFGGLRALLDAIDRLRATDEGQQALDVLLGIVRKLRSVGVPTAGLLSPTH